jgi:hypothetical protein
MVDLKQRKKYNGKLEHYINCLYTKQSKANVLLFTDDPRVNPKDKIGNKLFKEHYYEDLDNEIKNCEYKDLLY